MAGMDNQAFWVSPNGKRVIDVVNVTERSGGDYETIHIGEIKRHPELFGFTKERIEQIYKDNGEALGQESKSREEIMMEVMKNGWIRVRYYPKDSAWSVQVDTSKYNGNMSQTQKDAVWAFLIKASKIDVGLSGEGFETIKMHPDEFAYISNTSGELLFKPDRITSVVSKLFVEVNSKNVITIIERSAVVTGAKCLVEASKSLEYILD